SVFYKKQPERPTIDQLIFPERLQAGDRFTRVFQREMEFSHSSHHHVIEELFATFNGHGKALPPNTLLPRSICVGDIIVIDELNGAFVITGTGFDNLTFVPSGDNFEVPQTLSRQLAATNSKHSALLSSDRRHKVRTHRHCLRLPMRPSFFSSRIRT